MGPFQDANGSQTGVEEQHTAPISNSNSNCNNNSSTNNIIMKISSTETSASNLKNSLNFMETIPAEILSYILFFFADAEDVISLSHVSKLWYELSLNEEVRLLAIILFYRKNYFSCSFSLLLLCFFSLFSVLL